MDEILKKSVAMRMFFNINTFRWESMDPEISRAIQQVYADNPILTLGSIPFAAFAELIRVVPCCDPPSEGPPE
jgi:hypothetical protein